MENTSERTTSASYMNSVSEGPPRLNELISAEKSVLPRHRRRRAGMHLHRPPRTVHNSAFPSSEEESMAEVEDDYDDESCSSCSEVISSRERLDLTLNKKDSPPPTTLLPATTPPTITMPPQSLLLPRSNSSSSSNRHDDNHRVLDMLRNEETASEGPHHVVVDSSCTLLQSETIIAHDDTGQVEEEGKVPPTDPIFHEPRALPKFPDPKTCMWTSSHAANSPSEDRSCSLVNVLLRPLPEDQVNDINGGHVSVTASSVNEGSADNRTLIRLSLWSVIDGHGGGCVATYASEVLLPHIAASIGRALKCEIVDRGVCTVNGELRDANALDLDGLIRTSDQSRSNANSIHYRAPYDVAEKLDAVTQDDHLAMSEEDTVLHDHHSAPSMEAEASVASLLIRESSDGIGVDGTTSHSVSSVKTSVKTAASNHAHAGDTPVGTHGPGEVANITRAISESFLAVDEGWINSIDPVATHQTSCQSNGRWNAGACALVVLTVQRLEWTSTSVKNRRADMGGQDQRDDTSHNKDAARRRMLDYAAKAKSASSMSTISSTSSMLTEADPNAVLSANESEITETEDDGEESDLAPSRSKSKARQATATLSVPKQTVITTPGGCECHVYRPHEAILYTAHVGDCRAVLLGNAPPRTINVRPGACGTQSDHPDTTDDESSYHSSDETECLSSSDHDAESSDEEDPDFDRRLKSSKTPPYLKYMRRPRRQSRRNMGNHAPFVALPPLPIAPHSSSEEGSESSETETLASPIKPERVSGWHESDDNSNESSLFSQHGRDMSPPLELAPFTRPIDLTTDHSAYNPVEVSAVLRRSNNAPRAISAGVGGGIKRVAGSLAVTRALGDAYLKTPMLSFNPYKNHAPYITARPEVSCRLLTKDGDRVLILATDGVWERCSGEDVLRWVRNYSAERISEAERKKNRRKTITAECLPTDTVAHHHNPEDMREEANCMVGQKRDRPAGSSSSSAVKKRKVVPSALSAGRSGCYRSACSGPGTVSTVADVIVRRVLNKVRRARNMSSLHALMSLPKGRARRSKHDDITASVIDLSNFVS